MLARRVGARVLPWIVGYLVFVGVFASMSRYLMPRGLYEQMTLLLYGQYAPDQMPVLARHPIIEFAHRFAGAFYMVIGATQFMPRFRARHLKLHRWLGRVFIALTVVAGLSASVIVIVFPYAGLPEAIPVLLFSVLITLCGIKAYWHARRREIAAHREWVIRSFSIGLGVSTIRIVYLIMLYTTRMVSFDLLVSSFWLGWVLSLLTAELWINATRPRAAHPVPATVQHSS